MDEELLDLDVPYIAEAPYEQPQREPIPSYSLQAPRPATSPLTLRDLRAAAVGAVLVLVALCAARSAA